MYRVAAVDGRPSVGPSRRSIVLLLFLVLNVAHAQRAEAQAAAPQRVVILRGGAADVDDVLREEIDRAVVESMTGRRGFSSVDASPVPFEDVELAAGCNGRDADCLQRIAATLEADWLMVRELSRDREGNTYLTLIAHDGPEARITRRAVAEVSEHPQSAPSRVVPLLIDRLYPTLPPAASAPPEGAPAPLATESSRSLTPQRRDGRWSTMTIAGVATIGASAVALTSGITLWALSRRDARAYEKADIRSPSSADEAIDLHDRAERRARLGRGLVVGGTLAAVAGAVTLLWTPLRQPRGSSARLALGLGPARAGLNLALSGSWRGAL